MRRHGQNRRGKDRRRSMENAVRLMKAGMLPESAGRLARSPEGQRLLRLMAQEVQPGVTRWELVEKYVDKQERGRVARFN
jgi:hypothetical protein